MNYYDLLLAKKMGGGGGSSVTVEPLSVTQNGTYTAPSGKAYSPVSVNVSGGSSVEEKDVNFYDYDGMLLHSYTAEEFAQLSELPSNPSHDGLTAQGWNWTKAQIQTQLSDVGGAVNVGQMYITTSGDTEIDIELDNLNKSPTLVYILNGTAEIYWGDGTKDSVTGNSYVVQKQTQHTYANGGEYTISFRVISGSFSFYGGTNDSNCYTMLCAGATTSSKYGYIGTVKNIRFGSGISAIYPYGLYGARNLQTVTFPNTMTSGYGNGAFYNCYSLKCLIFPSGWNSSGPMYFVKNCYDLKTISYPVSTQGFGTQQHCACDSLEKVTIPYSLTTVNATSCFTYCTKLKELYLPNVATYLGDNICYQNYSLAKVTIPSNITRIQSMGFYDCVSLQEVHVKGTTPPTLQTSVFTNAPSTLTIYVPSGSVEDYKAASNWSSFSSQIVGE